MTEDYTATAARVLADFPGEAAGLVAEEIRHATIECDAERAAFWMLVRARVSPTLLASGRDPACLASAE